MARRQRDELIAPAEEERVGADQERAGRCWTRVAKAASNSSFVAGIQDMNLQPQARALPLAHVSSIGLGVPD